MFLIKKYFHISILVQIPCGAVRTFGNLKPQDLGLRFDKNLRVITVRAINFGGVSIAF